MSDYDYDPVPFAPTSSTEMVLMPQTEYDDMQATIDSLQGYIDKLESTRLSLPDAWKQIDDMIEWDREFPDNG